MQSLLRRLRQQVKAIPRKIWFLPLLLVVGFLVLSMVIIALRYSEPVRSIDKELEFLALTSEETARSIINTLTGGLISLMVFSFSMVMLVLSQASAQFSPRLLPGLISRRQHQFTLGFYLGSIIYNLSVLARIGPTSIEQTVPIIAVLLAILFGVAGLILFIMFITTISNSVRIDTILNNLHNTTKRTLLEGKRTDHAQGIALPEEAEDWQTVNCDNSGYVLELHLRDMKMICERHDLRIRILPYDGQFILRGEPVLGLSRTVGEEVVRELMDCIPIAVQEDLPSDRLHGLRQIVEIAVKAMSPGINDPATAVNAIDFLTSLLDTYLNNRPYACVITDTGDPVIWLTPRPLQEVLFSLFSPLRTYSAGDIVVTRKIIYALRQLHSLACLEEWERDLLLMEIEKLKEDASERLTNPEDLKLIEKI